MEMTIDQAKELILNTFIASRLPEIRTSLHTISTDAGDAYKQGPTTQQMANYLQTTPPRIMRHLQPLINNDPKETLIVGIDEAGFRWWYKGMRRDIMDARPDLKPIFSVAEGTR